MRGENSSVETVNAAAAAIANAERRAQQVTTQRRRWGGCLSAYFCFGDSRNIGRIGHASFSPERTLPRSAYITWAPGIAANSSALVLPFIAPPSSPTSTLQSEPSSATQREENVFSGTVASEETCSSGAAASMFTVGPFSHETQLVSPPVFSSYTTEPSTASLTPPEPVHITTPSSPEVPLSQLLLSSLDSNLRKGYGRRPPYQHYSGSSASKPVSSSCGCSGSPTPFPDFEPCSSSGVTSDNVSQQISRLNSMQVDDQIHTVDPVEDLRNNSKSCDPIVGLGMSSKLEDEDATRPTKGEQEFKAILLPNLRDDSSEPVESLTDDTQKPNSVMDQRMFTINAEEVAQHDAKDEQELQVRAGPDWRVDAFKKAEDSMEHSHHGNAIGDPKEMLVPRAEKASFSTDNAKEDIKASSLDSCQAVELIAELTGGFQGNHPELVVRASPELEAADVFKITKQEADVVMDPAIPGSRPDFESQSIDVSRQADESFHRLPQNVGLSGDKDLAVGVVFEKADESRLLPRVGSEWWMKEDDDGFT